MLNNVIPVGQAVPKKLALILEFEHKMLSCHQPQ